MRTSPLIDISEAIGGENWLYSCDELVKDLKELIKEKDNDTTRT